MKKLFVLNIFSALLAFFTSVVQTLRIIKNTKKSNRTNLILIFILAIFAAAVSVFQSNVIIKKITKKTTRKITTSLEENNERK